MLYRIFKKIKRLFTPITICKQVSLYPRSDGVDIVIIRRNDNGHPVNTVWLYGDISTLLFRLFDIEGARLKPTKLGLKYGAELTGASFKINLTRPFPLRQLARDLKIRRIILVYIVLPVLY